MGDKIYREVFSCGCSGGFDADGNCMGGCGWHPGMMMRVPAPPATRQEIAEAVRFAPTSAEWSAKVEHLLGEDATAGMKIVRREWSDAARQRDRLAELLRKARPCVLLTAVQTDNPTIEQRFNALLEEIDAAMSGSGSEGE